MNHSPNIRPILRAILVGFLLLSSETVFGQSPPPSTEPVRSHDTPAARRVTDALNLLESQGYAEFDNFREEESLFAADAKLDGRGVFLLIDPDQKRIRVLQR